MTPNGKQFIPIIDATQTVTETTKRKKALPPSALPLEPHFKEGEEVEVRGIVFKIVRINPRFNSMTLHPERRVVPVSDTKNDPAPELAKP